METISLHHAFLTTPLGLMIAFADETALHALQFADRGPANSASGRTEPIDQVERELEAYFKGALRSFQTPLFRQGTPFQQLVWDALLQIPYGAMASYKELATTVQHPSACRAVAQANRRNRFAILIPCHRVIESGGGLGGYAGGVERKRQLLALERQY